MYVRTQHSKTPTNPQPSNKPSSIIMSTAAASSSHRRSSRRVRSDDSPPSAADSSNYGLTADETALQLLVQNVLEGDWTAARDPDNVMKKIWVRSGRGVEGGGECAVARVVHIVACDLFVREMIYLRISHHT